MIYFIRPLKVAIDLDGDTFARGRERECPPGTMMVDWLVADPHTTQTRFEPDATVHYRPANLLHLNAYDLVSVVTVMQAIGWLTSKRYHKPFYGNPDDALTAAGRVVFPNLPVAGESAYFRNRQFRARPDAWLALHGLTRK